MGSTVPDGARAVTCAYPLRLNAEAPAYYSVLQDPVGAEAQALGVLERELESRHKQGEPCAHEPATDTKVRHACLGRTRDTASHRMFDSAKFTGSADRAGRRLRLRALSISFLRHLNFRFIDAAGSRRTCRCERIRSSTATA